MSTFYSDVILFIKYGDSIASFRWMIMFTLMFFFFFFVECWFDLLMCCFLSRLVVINLLELSLIRGEVGWVCLGGSNEFWKWTSWIRFLILKTIFFRCLFLERKWKSCVAFLRLFIQNLVNTFEVIYTF